MLHIITERIRNKLDSELPPEQAGVRRGRGTRNQDWELEKLNGEDHGISAATFPLFHRLHQDI